MPKQLTPEQLEAFEKCLSVWTPTRKHKGVAKKAWLKYAVPAVESGETTFNEIFERILGWNRYFKAMNRERQYIKLFETWIRNEGWLDDIPSASEARGAEIKENRFYKPNKDKKSDKTVARARINEIRGLLK